MNPSDGDKKSTKEQIILEALRLFARKGYRAVTVAEIAKAVNVSAPALYKHYGSKQEILDAILARSEEDYEKEFGAFNVDFVEHPEKKDFLINISVEEQINLMVELCFSTLHVEYQALLRRFMLVEQFNMPLLNEIYEKRYLKDPIESHAKFFQLLMDAGKMRKADPSILAIEYISPILMLIEICDRDSSKEAWAMEKLIAHVRQFNKIYRID